MIAGRHLIMDCVLTDASLPIVNSVELMKNYLEKVTQITVMTLVIPPIAMSFTFSGETNKLIERLDEEGKCLDSQVFKEFKEHIKHRNEDQGGVSAITVWLESHASLHSWPQDKYISIDLFSCKLFEADPIIEFTKDFMKLKESNILIVDRNMDKPANISKYTMVYDF